MEKFLVSPIRCYYELELPRATGRGRSPLLIALHGYEGDKGSMMRLARRIADGRMVVISLQGPNQFFRRDGEDAKSFRVGFGWGTTYKMEESVQLHHRNLRSLISLAARKYRADPRRVFLLAFSQACSYNYRFVFTHPREVRGAIAVCGGVPGDWHENPGYRRARTHVLHIAATRDEWYTREKNLQFRRQLSERAASLDFRFYNSTHRFPRSSIPHIRKWIEKHL
jgi:predicted esterase